MDIDQLRRDFTTVREWCVKHGEWTADEGAEIGAGIGDAVKARADGELAFWADWMARYALMAREHTALVTEMERAAAAWAMDRVRRAA